jgi:hypothetical protein
MMTSVLWKVVAHSIYLAVKAPACIDHQLTASVEALSSTASRPD